MFQFKDKISKNIFFDFFADFDSYIRLKSFLTFLNIKKCVKGTFLLFQCNKLQRLFLFLIFLRLIISDQG